MVMVTDWNNSFLRISYQILSCILWMWNVSLINCSFLTIFYFRCKFFLPRFWLTTKFFFFLVPIASAPDLCQTMENLSVQDDLATQVSKVCHDLWFYSVLLGVLIATDNINYAWNSLLLLNQKVHHSSQNSVNPSFDYTRLNTFNYMEKILPSPENFNPLPALTLQSTWDLTLSHTHTAGSRSEPPMSLLLVLAFCQ
jgi:hypothetical protein